MSQRCVCEREPASQLCACLTNPPPEGCGCLINPDAPECKLTCPDADVRAHIKQALMLADDGEWDDARDRIRCARQADPEDARARRIESQFEEDFFEKNYPPGSVNYTVKAGDTLGTIAKQCLNDTDLFIALALVNDLERPADLFAGQQLTIPGTQTCRVRERDPLESALQAEQRGDYETAHQQITEALRRSPDDGEIAAAALRIKTAYIAQLRDAAYARQDAGQNAEALQIWRRVLELDPQNKEALLNISVLERAVSQ